MSDTSPNAPAVKPLGAKPPADDWTPVEADLPPIDARVLVTTLSVREMDANGRFVRWMLPDRSGHSTATVALPVAGDRGVCLGMRVADATEPAGWAWVTADYDQAPIHVIAWRLVPAPHGHATAPSGPLHCLRCGADVGDVLGGLCGACAAAITRGVVVVDGHFE